MVKMACIDCGAVEFEAHDLHEMLTNMMPHYFEAHQDMMSSPDEERNAWMERFTLAFKAASDA
jgi:hypothetical protein